MMPPTTGQLGNNETIRAALAHPVTFARGILRDDPWDMQREILTAVAQHRRVAVKACHNSEQDLSRRRDFALVDHSLQ
jgi:hypothetical protein